MDRIFKTNEDEIEHLFTYHAPTPEQIGKYAALRAAAKALASVIFITCPGGADRSAAIRQLRECVMTANASIALDQGLGYLAGELQPGYAVNESSAQDCKTTQDRMIPHIGRY